MTHTETVTVDGVEFDVQFDYQPEERPVYYDSCGDPGHAGCQAEIEIQDIIHCGESLFEVFEDDLKKFEDAIFNLNSEF